MGSTDTAVYTTGCHRAPSWREPPRPAQPVDSVV